MLLLCSGSIRLHWCLDSRKRSTNRTDWCRNGQKAPLEFLKLIFSLPYFTPPPLFALLYISIALLSQPCLSNGPGVAPLIFHISLFLPFDHFPKALWVSGGKLLATDYSYTVISPCPAPLWASFQVFLPLFPFHFHLSLVVLLVLLPPLLLSLVIFYVALLSFTHFQEILLPPYVNPFFFCVVLKTNVMRQLWQYEALDVEQHGIKDSFKHSTFLKALGLLHEILTYFYYVYWVTFSRRDLTDILHFIYIFYKVSQQDSKGPHCDLQ